MLSPIEELMQKLNSMTEEEWEEKRQMLREMVENDKKNTYDLKDLLNLYDMYEVAKSNYEYEFRRCQGLKKEIKKRLGTKFGKVAK